MWCASEQLQVAEDVEAAPEFGGQTSQHPIWYEVIRRSLVSATFQGTFPSGFFQLCG
jgi:hypothetical protein